MERQRSVRIELVGHSKQWAAWYLQQEQRIRCALGPAALVLEHVGSTAVPGLIAKPVLDVCLGAPEPPDEPRYVPSLEQLVYHLRIREPDWFEHRLLTLRDPAVNLHVFAADSPVITRMIRFRNRLRSHAADRHRYAAAKTALAARCWPSAQDDANAKTGTITAILA